MSINRVNPFENELSSSEETIAKNGRNLAIEEKLDPESRNYIRGLCTESPGNIARNAIISTASKGIPISYKDAKIYEEAICTEIEKPLHDPERFKEAGKKFATSVKSDSKSQEYIQGLCTESPGHIAKNEFEKAAARETPISSETAQAFEKAICTEIEKPAATPSTSCATSKTECTK